MICDKCGGDVIMTLEQKSLEILRVLADLAADGKSLTIAADWDYGTATLIDQSGAHTHFGNDNVENKERNFEFFVDGLHQVIVENSGLSWKKK